MRMPMLSPRSFLSIRSLEVLLTKAPSIGLDMRWRAIQHLHHGRHQVSGSSTVRPRRVARELLQSKWDNIDKTFCSRKSSPLASNLRHANSASRSRSWPGFTCPSELRKSSIPELKPDIWLTSLRRLRCRLPEELRIYDIASEELSDLGY